MTRAMFLSVLAGLVVAALLAGCTMVSELTPTPEPAEQLELAEQRFDLIGTSWQVESFGGEDDMLPVLPDTKLSLNMLLERYAGYDGCNWFLGVYEIDGVELRYYTPSTTSFICQDEAVSAQAATYTSALVNITRYEMDGEKLVTYTVGDQQMATFVPAEPVPVEGTPWTAKFVSDGQQMQPASTFEFTVSAVFENGKVTGSSGCTEYEADYVIDGNAITISNLTSGVAECEDPAGVDEVEDRYYAALKATTNFEALVTSMVFTGADGQDLIFFGTP